MEEWEDIERDRDNLALMVSAGVNLLHMTEDESESLHRILHHMTKTIGSKDAHREGKELHLSSSLEEGTEEEEEVEAK